MTTNSKQILQIVLATIGGLLLLGGSFFIGHRMGASNQQAVVTVQTTTDSSSETSTVLSREPTVSDQEYQLKKAQKALVGYEAMTTEREEIQANVERVLTAYFTNTRTNAAEKMAAVEEIQTAVGQESNLPYAKEVTPEAIDSRQLTWSKQYLVSHWNEEEQQVLALVKVTESASGKEEKDVPYLVKMDLVKSDSQWKIGQLNPVKVTDSVSQYFFKDSDGVLWK